MTGPGPLPGVVAVVPTPFHDDGTLDGDGLARLVLAYGEAGVTGFVVLGVMGEAPQLDDAEQRTVVSVARTAASGLPLVVGLGEPGPDQPGAARRAADLGADVLLAGLGPGSPGARRGLLAAVAAVGAPVVVQDHPAATGVHVPPEEVASLATGLGVAAVKAEAPPTPDLVAAILAAGGPAVFGGLSALHLLEELEAGAAGSMTGVAVPELLVTVVARWHADDRTAARDAYLELCRWLRLEAAPGPSGLVARKEAWRQRGVIGSSRVRAGRPLGATTKAAITRRLQELGVPTPGGVVVA